jgi:iron-sulfur cluster assembly protein
MLRSYPATCILPLLALLAGCAGRVTDHAAGAPTSAAHPPYQPVEVAPPPREVVHLEITPAAARAIRSHAADLKSERWWLRYSIKGGGCTGFQDKLDLETTPPTSEDFESVVDGIPCLVLDKHRPYARGTRIDFGEKDGKTGFIVTHPPTAVKAIADACNRPDPPRPGDAP